MKAVLSKTPGGPESLVVEDVPAPEPGPGQVLIDVKSCAVNFPDLLMIQDLYQFKPERPFSPGGEIAGIVARTGPDVTALQPGQRVLSIIGNGGFAEQALAMAGQTLPIPDDMPFEDASALMFTYGTTYYALKRRAQLKKGEVLFVSGAAGGVGLAAVELGKTMGAHVIAGVSSQDKAELALKQGAAEAIVYPRGPLERPEQKAFSDEIKRKAATLKPGSEGADVVYDAVGGDYAEPAIRAMAWNGRFLVIGFPAGIPSIPLNLTLLKGCQIVGVFWGAHTMREPADFQADVKELFAMYGEGLIKPYISQRFSLENAADSLRALAERRAVGKLVVVPDLKD